MSFSLHARRRTAGVTVLLAGVAAAATVATAAGGPTFSTLPGAYSEPRGAAFMADGSSLVADTKNHRIYRVTGSGAQRVAGTGQGNFGGDGGPAVNARLKEPAAVAPIPGGGFLIADTQNHRIRKVDAAGQITTVAGTGDGNFSGDGGAAVAARVKEPAGIVATSATDYLFADAGNDRVRRVVGGQISSVGSGLAKPAAVAVRADGAVLVAEEDGGRVRVLQNGSTTALAGASGLNKPRGVAVLPDGGVLVSDTENHAVLEIRAGQQTVFAGTGRAGAGPDGPAAGAELDKPEGLAVDDAGRVLVANTHADRVHLITPPPASPAPTSPAPASPAAPPAPAALAPSPSPERTTDDGSTDADVGRDADGPGADGVAATLLQAAAPKLRESVTTAVARGTVRVRPAGSDDYVTLEEAAAVPVGSIVDTTRGAVRLTAAKDAAGATQTATFFDGAFRVTQTAGRQPLTDLALSGPVPACTTGARKLARTSAKRTTRRLWGDGKGRFRTKGRHSSATVRGTRWLTEDRCDGTLVKVVRGVVGVRDLARRTTVTVKGGKQYLAKAPAARRRASR